MNKVTYISPIKPATPDDLFIVCASFEERRCRESVLRTMDYTAKRTVILNFRSASGKSGSKKQEKSALYLIEKLRGLDLRGMPRLISTDPYDYFGLWYALTDELSRHGLRWGDLTITIDISCFTKVQLIFLLRELLITRAFSQCRLLYTAPEHYNREKGDKFSWLAVGYFDPFVFPIKSEIRSATNRRRTALVVLGHEGQRTLTAWRYIDPDETILVFAESDNKVMMEICRRENDFLLSRVGGEDSSHVVKCGLVDIIRIRDQISEELSTRGAFTVSLVPFGPKPLVIGILLAILQSCEVDCELVYPVPTAYNPDYSSGARSIYAFDLGGI